jgi:hypothetical protein
MRAWLVAIAACSARPPPPATLFTAGEAARACATLATCFPNEWAAQDTIWGGTISACASDRGYVPEPGTMLAHPIVTQGFEPAFARLYGCILDAPGDCGAAAACLAQTGSPGTCKPDALEAGECSGSVLSGCTSDGYAFAVDCAADGETCGAYPAIFAHFSGCVTPCPAQVACDGTREQLCLSGALVTLDCGELGTTCANGACTPQPGPACDAASFRQRCDGDVVVTCADGIESRDDCSIWPTHRRCAVDTLGSAQCVLTGTECTAGDACAGDDIAYCRDGYAARVSCTALGFSTCSAARCVP